MLMTEKRILKMEKKTHYNSRNKEINKIKKLQ